MRIGPPGSCTLLGLILLVLPAPSSAQGTWSEILPNGRWMAACAHDANLNEMIVYGGYKEGGPFPFPYALDGRVLRLSLNGVESWSEMITTGGPPTPRAGATLVYDPDGNRMILFGGASGEAYPPFNSPVYLGDVWALDLVTHVWSPLSPTGTAPSARAFHTAVYDPGHQRMVVFGGSSATGDMNDTWELTLSGPVAWAPLATAGGPPGVRSRHTAVFDPTGRMLVYGGAGGTYSDTWELTLPVDTGTPTWSQLATLGSAPPRFAHAAVFDAANARMIVFGGRQPGPGQTSPRRNADVWILSLPTLQWTNPIYGAPPGSFRADREFPGAVYDSAHERLVVYGGSGGVPESYNPQNVLGDTWALTFDAAPEWKPLTPPPRAFAAVTWDEVRNRMLVFGGTLVNTLTLRDLWAYDPTPPGHWSFIAPAGSLPFAREGATLVHDVANDRFLLFGGYSAIFFNDVWSFSPNPPTWTQLSPSGGPPPARRWHTAVVDEAGGRMVVFGGIDLAPRSDLWTLSLDGPPVWSQPLASNPTGRYGHSAVFDPVDWDDPNTGHMIVFGGTGGGVDKSDTQDWSATATPFWSTMAAGSPPARHSSAAAYDGARDQMLLFGGRSGSTTSNALWMLPLYGTHEWSQQTPSGTLPLPRYGARAVYDPVHDWMLVLGGQLPDQGHVFPEFWQLDRSGVPVGVDTPAATELRVGPIWPNPTRGRVRLALELPRTSEVRVEVFDVAGRIVHLSTRSLPPGAHAIEWDGRVVGDTKAPPGIYLARVKASGQEETRRFVLLR